MKKTFLSYEEAKEYVRAQGVKTTQAYFKWRTNGRPPNIPAAPHRTYKGKGWISYGEFLGSGKVHSKRFVPIEKAQVWAAKNGLNTKEKYQAFKPKPPGIPTAPERVYMYVGWHGWGDFLGTGNVHIKPFLPYEEAVIYVSGLKFKTQKAYQKWCVINKPKNIPSRPEVKYKDAWICWGDYLGNGTAKKHRRPKTIIRLDNEAGQPAPSNANNSSLIHDVIGSI